MKKWICPKCGYIMEIDKLKLCLVCQTDCKNFIGIDESEEKFYIELREKAPGGVIIALPGVAGLNAAEHLRSLWSECGLIWCSDLDFSLHAYRLRAEYFIKAPFVETELAEGLSRWMKNRRF